MGLFSRSAPAVRKEQVRQLRQADAGIAAAEREGSARSLQYADEAWEAVAAQSSDAELRSAGRVARRGRK
jgi:hypothetical protein